MVYYSFTFTIPAPKKVYYAGRRRAYGSMNQLAQSKFLNNLMTQIIHSEDFEFIDWIFEAHTDGRLHLHGYCHIVKETSNPEFYIKRLQHDFYSYNMIVGLTSFKNYDKLCDVQETRTNINYWLEYINKNQDTIIFKSPQRTEQDNQMSLDKGVCKIEERIINTDNDDYYDTYRFGVSNKFTVEI
jgi:hypothetical protein